MPGLFKYVFLVQQAFAGAAVGTVGLGEDDYAVVFDDLLGLLLCGGHGGGRRWRRAGEKCAGEVAERSEE